MTIGSGSRDYHLHNIALSRKNTTSQRTRMIFSGHEFLTMVEGTYSIIMGVSKPIILVNFTYLITQALFLCTGLNFTANLSAI